MSTATIKKPRVKKTNPEIPQEEINPQQESGEVTNFEEQPIEEPTLTIEEKPAELEEIEIEKSDAVIPLNIEEEIKNETAEEKIVKYVNENGKVNFVKINSLLKELFMSKDNQHSSHAIQGESKRVRIFLDNLLTHGLMEIRGNAHARLGTFYYNEDAHAKTYTLDNLDIYAK